MESTTYQIIDTHTGQTVGAEYPYAKRRAARARRDRLNASYGAARYSLTLGYGRVDVR